MNKRFIMTGLCLSVFTGACVAQSSKTDLPNIVYILTDDMGYGDVGALNPDCKIPTPNLDGMAAKGMAFTDAHTSSSVCTPTRYNVLTGRYNWRTHLKSGVLDGYGKPLIDEDRLTLASLCRDNGYRTAMIGKWHLGMELPLVDEGTGIPEGDKKNHYVDWTKSVKRTPTSNGFDYFWGHGASLDFPPYTYIENEDYTTQNVRYLTNKEIREDLKVTTTFRPGWVGDDFDHFQTMDEFCDRAAAYIREADDSKPFFLYVPLTSPHTPIIPTSEWKGKSGLNDYGDFVMQTDAGIGRILQALKDAGIEENTLVVFTADNGCSPRAEIDELQAKGHSPNYIYRGTKADIWEGGHRVPHLVQWPAQVKAGSQTDRLTVLGDIVATVADIVDVQLPDYAAEDSISFYDVLQGNDDPTQKHEAIINHSVSGQFAVRSKQWKLIFCPGSGGWSSPKDAQARKQGLPEYQLYDIVNDPQETNNLINEHPEVVEQLTALASDMVRNGRSTPGAPQKNDTPNAWKQLGWMK
ncbi:arylsulfatase [Pontiellaceae bacterium B12219]|nr:arylsulfatase [Pontiellaceae bacterium B12219]